MITAVVSFGLLIVFYFFVIAPFTKKMLETKPQDELDLGENIIFDAEEFSEDTSKLEETKRKIKKTLDLQYNNDEEKIKKEILIERIKENIENSPKETGTMFNNLLGKEKIK